MTVLVWGTPTDPPAAMVLHELAGLRADVALAHPVVSSDQQVRLTPAGGTGPGLSGTMRVGRRQVALEDLVGAYVRPVQVGSGPPGAPAHRTYAMRVHDALIGFTEAAPSATGCRVANRFSAMASNTSKPYQAQAVRRHGFATPETLVSSDPDEVLDFAARHRQIVYKSASGVRSVVTQFDEAADAGRLHRLRRCPVQCTSSATRPSRSSWTATPSTTGTHAKRSASMPG